MASTWAVYSDTACTKSIDTIDGQNGYPDGVCTSVPESYSTDSFKGFMFITLDDGCSPTIYQPDTTSDTCSGYAIVASIATCYNTSWAYYSIDMCSKAAATSTSSSSTATSTASSGSSSEEGMSGGDMAGAVVGSVCGLGVIAAVSVYLFWVRPKQQRKRKLEQDETGLTSDAANGAQDSKDQRYTASENEPHKAVEMQQLPGELSSPTDTTELPSAVSDVLEVSGDRGGFELHPESHAVELPGDHEYRSSESMRSNR